ncbi:MAG: hypothetical protein RML32_06715, partial [Gammaproteobacteria bacterium]|nr:hypothetical protein [Gammaproteobacteria bacterium]
MIGRIKSLNLPRRRAASLLPGLFCAVWYPAIAAPHYALPAMTTPDYCALVQRFLAGTALQARNVIHTDYQAFVASKPAVQPLTTHQYVLYSDDAPRLPLRVSCKLKTPDHLNAAFGAGTAARKPRLCREANQQAVLAVYA